jgi:hypothetical protein
MRMILLLLRGTKIPQWPPLICKRCAILNEAKTIFMLIGQKGDLALFNIFINGLRIPPSLEVQLLAFTIDYRLSWVPHLKRRLEAAKRAFHSLRASLRATCGFDRRRFFHLYYTSVEPILLYGCSVWAPTLSTKKGIKLLRSFQRLFAASVTKAFQTSSIESLLVLSNSLPLDLRVLEISILRFR